ncbi:MAG: Fic family protein [Acidobacteria bacterium]|nr:Fic family protein [Acidobacteriota bacterium]
MPTSKPPEAIWRRITDLPAGASTWTTPGYAERVITWRRVLRRLTDRHTDRSMLDTWLRERRRWFAIETGLIEGLYTLKRGVTEQLVTEGLEGVRGGHTVEGLADETIQGLLRSQEEALEVVFGDVRSGRPLTHHTLCAWHQLLTRSQETATGITPWGARIEIPLRRGRYKIRPNNPKRPDGVVHEYCPPEQVRSEMDRFLTMHEGHDGLNLPTEVEAAWLHHRFVRIHPFQDGNGRMARLLLAYVYLRNEEIPPVVTNEHRDAYIRALEAADRNDLRPFVDFLGLRAAVSLEAAIGIAEDALAGRNRLHHPNGGVTRDGVYYRREDAEST